jgi:hypothetical protein
LNWGVREGQAINCNAFSCVKEFHEKWHGGLLAGGFQFDYLASWHNFGETKLIKDLRLEIILGTLQFELEFLRK